MGAYDPKRGRVFLQVWEDQIRATNEGEVVEVFWDKPRLDTHKQTYDERREHVARLDSGARGYGVICRAVDTSPTGPREIAGFDERELLRLGNLTRSGPTHVAKIVGRFPVSEVHRITEPAGELATDLDAVLQDPELDPTTKERLVDARIGQGIFRAGVLNLWDHRCCVTGSTLREAIRASHIKPWRLSSNIERLDSSNGLPLLASFDALFDAGLISFSDNGHMVVSSMVNDTERIILDLAQKSLRKRPSERTAAYLAHHREVTFKP